MSTGQASDLAAALRAALKGVDGVRHAVDPGNIGNPPVTVLGPPTLRWDGYHQGPTDVSFTAYLVVIRDERAPEELLRLLPAVSAAIDDTEVASVREARPGLFTSGGSDLPCYELTLET